MEGSEKSCIPTPSLKAREMKRAGWALTPGRQGTWASSTRPQDKWGGGLGSHSGQRREFCHFKHQETGALSLNLEQKQSACPSPPSLGRIPLTSFMAKEIRRGHLRTLQQILLFWILLLPIIAGCRTPSLCTGFTKQSMHLQLQKKSSHSKYKESKWKNKSSRVWGSQWKTNWEIFLAQI